MRNPMKADIKWLDNPEVFRINQIAAHSDHEYYLSYEDAKSENKKLYDLILQMGDFDQLIDESDFSWVHVSYKRVGYNRKQTLKL